MTRRRTILLRLSLLAILFVGIGATALVQMRSGVLTGQVSPAGLGVALQSLEVGNAPGYCCSVRNSGLACHAVTQLECLRTYKGAFVPAAAGAQRMCDYQVCGRVGFCCVENEDKQKTQGTVTRGTQDDCAISFGQPELYSQFFYEDEARANKAAQYNCREEPRVCCDPSVAEEKCSLVPRTGTSYCENDALTKFEMEFVYDMLQEEGIHDPSGEQLLGKCGEYCGRAWCVHTDEPVDVLTMGQAVMPLNASTKVKDVPGGVQPEEAYEVTLTQDAKDPKKASKNIKAFFAYYNNAQKKKKQWHVWIEQFPGTTSPKAWLEPGNPKTLCSAKGVEENPNCKTFNDAVMGLWEANNTFARECREHPAYREYDTPLCQPSDTEGYTYRYTDYPNKGEVAIYPPFCPLDETLDPKDKKYDLKKWATIAVNGDENLLNSFDDMEACDDKGCVIPKRPELPAQGAGADPPPGGGGNPPGGGGGGNPGGGNPGGANPGGNPLGGNPVGGQFIGGNFVGGGTPTGTANQTGTTPASSSPGQSQSSAAGSTGGGGGIDGGDPPPPPPPPPPPGGSSASSRSVSSRSQSSRSVSRPGGSSARSASSIGQCPQDCTVRTAANQCFAISILCRPGYVRVCSGTCGTASCAGQCCTCVLPSSSSASSRSGSGGSSRFGSDGSQGSSRSGSTGSQGHSSSVRSGSQGSVRSASAGSARSGSRSSLRSGSQGSVRSGSQSSGGSARSGASSRQSTSAGLCGDGIVRGNERCDDGNNASGDGCSANCQLEFCGDGRVQTTRGEQCDPGSTCTQNPSRTCDENTDCRACGTVAGTQTRRCGSDPIGLLCDSDDDCVNTPYFCQYDAADASCGLNCQRRTSSRGSSGSSRFGSAGSSRSGFSVSTSSLHSSRSSVMSGFSGPGSSVSSRSSSGGATASSGSRSSGAGTNASAGSRSSSILIGQRSSAPDDEFCRLFPSRCTSSRGSAGSSRPPVYTSVCGNGISEPGEDCDDGNTNDTDSCTNACRIPPGPLCANGSLDGGEQCDDGNSTDGDGCEFNCTTTPFCSNRVVEYREQCDDGNLQDNDGCDRSCFLEVSPSGRAPVCGNGIGEPGEQCDDGNTFDGDSCDHDCRIPPPSLCGNGEVNANEQCDDGNGIDGDGCDRNCYPTPRCGNRVSEYGEQCDDGNTLAGDGCSPTCQLTSACGNGKNEPGEQCDDGNSTNGDGCSALCRVEGPGGTVVGSDIHDLPTTVVPPVAGNNTGTVPGSTGQTSGTTADVTGIATGRPPVGDTGPAAVAVMAAGAAAGWAFVRRKRKTLV